MTCGLCGGPCFYLGRLGCLHWYRCRDCGAEGNGPPPEDDTEDHEP